MAASITGDKELQKALSELKISAAKRAVQKGLSKAAMEGRKIVKASVPSRYKTVRKAIGWRALKRKDNNNEPGSKVGAGVGKRSKKKTSSKDRTGRAGVGIDVNNIHWWFMGTNSRQTKAGINRGGMPPQGEAISVTLSKNAGRLSSVIRTHTWVGIKKEVAKLKVPE